MITCVSCGDKPIDKCCPRQDKQMQCNCNKIVQQVHSAEWQHKSEGLLHPAGKEQHWLAGRRGMCRKLSRPHLAAHPKRIHDRSGGYVTMWYIHVCSCCHPTPHPIPCTIQYMTVMADMSECALHTRMVRMVLSHTSPHPIPPFTM